MPEKPEIQNIIVGIIGRKGSGKSTELENFLVQRDRVITIDPNGEHTWTPNEIDSLDELREFFKWNRKREQWAANFVPGENVEDDVNEAARIIFAAGDCAVGIDETTEFATAGHLPKALATLIRRGRHRGIDIFWTGLRAAEIPRKLTAQTDRFILYSQTEPLDIDAIAARCGRETADLVQGLGLHDKVCWDVWNGLARPVGLPGATQRPSEGV